MEGIEHRTVSVNGINMHVAEKGEGPVVLFLHGFPELWCTWRHQIAAFAALGYRAVAPDLRGYGDTDAPAEVSSYSCLHVVGDLVALIESLGGGDQVFLVAHDWGAMIGWYLCLFRPDLVKAYVSLTVPFRPRHPKVKPVEGMRAFFGEDYYMCRFQEPGKIESEIARYGAEAVIKKILTDRTPGPPCLPKETPFGSNIDDIKLPPWFTADDLKYYAQKYEKRGFTGGLNYYRALDLNWELTAAWTGAKVRVPVKFVVGDVDMVYTTPGVKEYVHRGGFKNDVPLLEECVVMDNVGHFLNQEKPDEVNAYIHEFIKKF
ncbi:UNVERIFIED_CONTAM: Epoxide hydrolase A [Sesamum radiatum]|uniref:soluble epoxide hydrolase n=1 Tax=Sesamum radiatum TaxID=300843 RepID=A0AAW2U7Z3_SESRA